MRHNNVASKVPCGKMLPYWYHISEVEECEMQQLKAPANDDAVMIDRFLRMLEGLSSIPSTLISCLY